MVRGTPFQIDHAEDYLLDYDYEFKIMSFVPRSQSSDPPWEEMKVIPNLMQLRGRERCSTLSLEMHTLQGRTGNQCP